MKANEFITESARFVKYDFHRLPDTNTFVATANGEEIGRFEGKSKFDSSAAQDAAKKCIVLHRSAAIDKENEDKEHEIQFAKPLSEIEKKWLQMHKKFYIDNAHGSEAEYDTYGKYAAYVRKSISRIPNPETHPLAKEYLSTLTESEIGSANQKAKVWIQKVYDMYPGMWQNNHVMAFGNGDDKVYCVFELMPSMTKRDAVEIKWIQAMPLRSKAGTQGMQELQRLAREDGITLTLFPWDKGQVSQAKLTKFYKGQGFKPTVKGAKAMYWEPNYS